MDGTYNNPYAQGQSQSPLSPQMPGGYQVNVSRQKTRKWVQAPVQNYDGDDWGADEFDDDEPQPPPPVPRVTTGLRSVGQRPPESYGPSPRLAAAVASSSRSSSGPPSLQLQTQDPAGSSHDATSEPIHNVSSPVTGRNGSPAPVSSVAGSSKPPSFQQQPDVRSSTPQSPSSSARASPSIRPDLYRHIDDERKLGGSPLSIAENVAPRPNDHSTPPVHSQQGYGQGDGPMIDRVQKQPTFDSILAKRDELHVGQPVSNDAPALDSAETSQQINNPKEEPVLHLPTDIDRTRMSVSPQLPDVARMSVFGADFFSSGNGDASAQDPVKQEQPLASKQSTSASGNLSTLNEKPQEGDDNGNGSRLDNALASNSSLIPANDPRSVPPLRTPSPNMKGLYPSSGDPASASTATGSKITPTEPLHPRPSDYSPSNYEPNSALTQGTMNTFNSSPIKESDVLSEEIMRSLSPIAPTPNSAHARPAPENGQSLTPGGQNEIRNSSYTLSDYDNYWADSNDKPEQGQQKLQVANAPAHEQQQQEPTEQPPPGVSTSSGPKPTSPPESPNAESRRRFSWEAGFDPPPKILAVEAPTGNLEMEGSAPTSTSPVASPDVQSSLNPVSVDTNQPNEAPRNIEAPKIVIPPSGGISHQVSKASTLPPSQQQTILEPPSPVSVEHDDSTPQATADRRPSVAEDKSLAKTTSNLTSATSPPEKSSRSVPSSSEFPQTTPWRDIMTLATPVQRTLKFEAGRDTHQAWESGLDNWLSSLMIEHPEYANSTASFSGAGSMPASQKGHASGPSVSHTQQHFNASSPTTGQPATGRSRLAGSVPSGSVGFGNSSNQIGTKSKELMQSAGKMGKGLFSKGKSKLRGTGDKGEPTSPVQTKLKAERRASWGLDRLTRSRADETSEKDVVNSRPSTQSYHAPQSSQSSSIPPFGPVPSTGESGKQVASRESDEPQLSQDVSVVPSREHDDRSQWYIPMPIDESTWDPFREANLASAKASKESRALVASEDESQQSVSAEAPFSKPVSGGAFSVPAGGSVRMVPSEEHTGLSHQPISVYATVTAQETRRDVQYESQPQSPAQANDSSTTPQRHSSFVGLPPIRRGSTFDVNSRSTAIEQRTTEPINELVSVDAENYDEILRQQGTITSEVTVGSTLVGTDSIAPDKEYKKDIDDPETPAMTPERQRRASQQRSPQEVPRHSLQMHPANQGPMPPQNPEYQNPSLPLLPPHLMGGGGNPVQRMPPSGPWKLEESHLSEPLHRVTPKASPLLPSGQWKLEESHLAEPLHVVNRNRAGTNASQISQRSQRSQHSQQDPFFGYNKETGDVPTSPSSSSTTQHQHHHHQRQKPSEVPPSTTNRYPGLFPGQQRPQSNSQEIRPSPGPQFARRLSHEEGISRVGTGGSGVPVDDRGRSRGASALFKDIGHRFRKSSTERRHTPIDNHNPYQPPQLPEAHHDAASVSSVATDGTNDRKKPRASFMLGLRSKQSRERLSMPPPSRPEDLRPHSAMEENRVSRLNPGLGFDSAHSRPIGVPRAATSNLANELSQHGSATPPPKKRFSAFNAKAAMTNVFNRPSSGTYAKPGTPTSSRPVSSHLSVQQPVSLEQSHLGFERSNTAGPSFNQMLPIPPDAPPADAAERRTRRGSAAGLISGLLGHGLKNKEPQQSALSQVQQHPVQQSHDRRSSGPQLNLTQHEMLQAQDQRSSGPQPPTPALHMPGAFPETPGIPTPQSDAPPLSSPQPQRPQPFVNQQLPMVRQMTGGAVAREQSPMLTSRSSSGAMRESQHAQAAYRNSRPSPLGFGSMTPSGTPPIVTMTDHSRHGTPQTSFSVGQSFSDTRTKQMRSISPAAPGVRSAPTTQTSFNIPSTAPTTQTSFHDPSRSFEKLSQHMHEGAPVQRHATDSPNMSFRQNTRPGQIASDDGMPLSPVSQVSKTSPPSVSSMATQSPRLNSSFPTSGRRQSSQISQPETPIISAVSASPPVQAFTSRMGMSPQQPQSSNFQLQTGPRQGTYPMTSSQPPMQPQQSDGGSPVPPKNETSHLQKPQVVDQPSQQGSPGVSKWKGLKNRMSAQVAHKSQPSQGKTEADKDKLTTSKILGAFKRSSKENRQSMVIPDFQAYQQHQMGAPHQRQHPQQHTTTQAPYEQAQSSRPSSNVGGQPFGQATTSRPSSHLSNQSPMQLQYERQSSMFSSPPLPQQQFRSSSGSIPQGQPGMYSPQQVLAYQPPQPQGEPLSPSSPTGPTHSLPPPQQQGHYQSSLQHQGQFQSPFQQQGQFQSSPRQGHYQSPSLHQRQFPSPSTQQGQFGSPIQHQGQTQAPTQIQGQFQSPPQSLGQWQHETHSPSNQPLPAQSRQASYPGQWQGTIGQSPNSPAHQSPRHSHFSQQPYSPQPIHPSQQVVRGEESHPVHVSTPETVHAPTPVHAPSPRPSLLNLLASGSLDNEEAQQLDLGHTQAVPRDDQSNAISLGNSNTQRFTGSEGPYNSRTSGNRQASAGSSPTKHISPEIGTEQNGSSKNQAPSLPMPVFTSDSVGGSFMRAGAAANANGESQGVSISPPTATTGNSGSGPTRQSPSDMSDSRAPSQPKSSGGPSFHAELENTEDARKRTLRINSQEEKIHYDPNADSDGEVPAQMSATSYPGQEWNPYGMTEVGDWNEALYR
ncbi:unnamed protein product [Fusarium graminearum]|nr:hypothetical protein FG05_08939 [Fusarium graminearum]CAF3433121.1 unnamed protein product [Fusarium graminearum]CAG1960063.1 unnamed protein product [Fusarium graminearum]VTO84362.1 unnamed protein product [Fusarium graminearum]